MLNRLIKIFKLGLLVVALSIICRLNAVAQTTYLPHFTAGSGLPSNTCYFIHQDKKGFIWIATSNGVSRFDGTNFQNFGIEDGLPDTQILQIAEDRQNRLWFFALNGEISYLKNGVFYNSDNNKLLSKLKPNAVVVSFLQDKKGRIWLGTNSNLILCIDGNNIKRYVTSSNTFNFFNAFLHEDNQGNVYALTAGSVHIFDGKSFKKVNLNWNLPSIRDVNNIGRNSLAVLGDSGLRVFSGQTQQFVIPIPANVSKKNSGYLYFDHTTNRTWLATLNGAISIDSSLKTTKYLQDIAINQILKDKEQNLWFATNQGLFMLPKESSRLSILDAEGGLSSNVIKSITKDNSNRLWLGTDDAVIDILHTKTHQIEKLGLEDFKKFRTITQLVFDSTFNSVYYASEFGLGVFRNVDDGFDEIKELTEDNNSMYVVKNFGIDNKTKKLAVALSSGVVQIKDRLSDLSFDATKLNDAKNFLKGRAYHVYFDPSGNLWFSNLNGLAEVKDQNILTHYNNNQLLKKRINDIRLLQDGTLLLATDGYGLLFYKNNKIIRQLKQTDGLTNNICLKVFIKKNELWVLNSNGVNKIDNYGEKPQISNFDYGKDLLKDDVNDLFVDDSTAYFATNKGLVMFNYVRNRKNKSGPPVFITSIRKNKETLALNKRNFDFKSIDNSIFVTFSAIDFSTSDVTYRYRLNPDLPYIETKTRRLDFSSLQPGVYAFEVSAKSQNSDWGAPANINFSIAKPFWQQWWFIILSLFVVGLLFYRFAVYLTRKQKDKEQSALIIKNRILTLEQQALQAMMNPHFIFNVMNSIQHYINTQNTSSANKILTGFARLVRKNLEICTKSYITLEEELEYLKLYLKLEKNRFGDKLNYSFKIDDDLDLEDILIPSMLLQPYIENAIWHGIMPKETGGEIEISMQLKDPNLLEINIIDNGIGIQNSLQSKNSDHVSKGMRLTAERLRLLGEIDQKNIQLDVRQNLELGTTVTICIPI